MIVIKEHLSNFKKRFYTNIQIINNSFEIGGLKKVKYKKYILLFIITMYFFGQINGYQIVKVFSNSDQNGIYLSVPKKFLKYKKNEYVSFCVPSKNSLLFAELFIKSSGLNEDKSNICFNGVSPLVKHICAVPGDIISVNKNFNEKNLYINNKKSNIIMKYTNTKLNEVSWNNVKIRKDNYFICGSNPDSYDSRYYGSISKNLIYSKMILLIPLPKNTFIKE